MILETVYLILVYALFAAAVAAVCSFLLFAVLTIADAARRAWHQAGELERRFDEVYRLTRKGGRR